MKGLDKNHLPTIFSLVSSPPPRHLFHYTDSHGILGILKSKTIWATETQYLNDEREVEQAKNYIQLHASSFREADVYASQFSPDEKELLEALEDGAKVTRPGVCITAFSEERDQLSQWRAYSKQGGYALGLSGEALRECAMDQGFILARCTYDHRESYRIAGEILMNILRLYRASNDKSDEFKKKLSVQIAIDITKYGPLLKDRSFAEEKEWRIITPRIGIGRPDLNFRESDGKIVPYVSVDIERCLRHKGPDGTGVIVGPGRDYHLSADAIQALTHREIGHSVWHGRSASPFRSW